MKKREDFRIYEFCHKKVDYGFWDNELYTPIEVGAACREESVCKLRDNKGEGNISEWNPVYAELTGLHYIWKHLPKKVQLVGVCQYRRRLQVEENISVSELIQDCDAVFPEPLFLCNCLEEQYGHCHNLEDIRFCEEIVKDLYPEYAEDWDEAIKNNCHIFYSNSFIMKRDDFDKYCEWLFSIFDEYKKRKGWESVEDVRNYVQSNIDNKKHNPRKGLDYQMQLFGFLGERLMTVYVFHNFSAVKQIPYTKMEGTLI